MNRSKKAGILLATLVVPALVYLFIRFLGTNHYVLPRYIPEIDSTSGLVKMQTVTGRDGKPVQDTVFNRIPAFQLVDQTGQPATDALFRGKIHIASFFFTRCGTVCPKLSSQLTRVQDIFRKEPNLVFLSYSVDPEHDKPEQLREYATRYEAIPGKWYFLTGDKTVIYRLAQRGYYLPVVDAGVSNGNPDETFIHSEKLVLVDKDGIIRGFYDGTDKKDVDRLVLETRVLLDIYGKQ